MAYFFGKNILYNYTISNFENKVFNDWNHWNNFLRNIFLQINYVWSLFTYFKNYK